MIATTDGGRTWVRQGPLPSLAHGMSSLYFAPDALHGWALIDEATSRTDQGIIATADGGVTWTVQRSDPDPLLSVRFAPDNRHGTAVARSGALLISDDGGGSWSWRSQVRLTWLWLALLAPVMLVLAWREARRSDALRAAARPGS
jgi:photosystem II stability/assembly factor-like uncharacterized protein